VPRRTIGTVRKEFIRMCEPTLQKLAEVDALCEQLLRDIANEPVAALTLFDSEPPTRNDHPSRNGTKNKR
jgi:hypothetical protein